MRNSKLFYYLHQLDNRTLNAFKRFLASPFFVKKAEPVKLFEVMEKRLLKYKLRDLPEEEAFAAVYPGKAYDSKVFNKLKNTLHDLLMEFLAHRALKGDSGLKWLLAHQEVTGMGADKYFDFLHKKTRESLDPFQTNYFERARKLEMQWLLLKNQKAPDRSNSNLEKMDALLDQGYFQHKLTLAYRALTEAHLYDHPPQVHGLEEMVNQLRKNLDSHPPLVLMAYYRYMTILERDEPEHYYQLRQLLQAHGQKIESSIAYDMYIGALNYCIFKINQGQESFLKELLNLYQSMLKLGFLLVQEMLPPNHFKNMVILGARLKEFEWAWGFIKDYGSRLGPGEVGHALAYNRAVLLYFEEKLKSAEKEFLKVVKAPDDIFYGVDARTYLLRIYYETENFDGMDSLSHSFRIFLQRNKKLSLKRKESFSVFISLFRRLMYIPPRDYEKLTKLRSDILSSAKIAPRTWLLEKVESFINEIPLRYRKANEAE